MDVGDIRPREVIEVEDDKNQVLSNSNVQASGSYDQSKASSSQVQHLNQVINQMKAIKCKCFNLPML
jgi:hypothetical protein